MSFTIFQNEKTPFLAIKTRTSKSPKNRHFSKGVNPWFWFKNSHFSNFPFQATQARKMSITIFQNEKTPFQAIKTKSSKSRNIDILPQGLTDGFGPKITIFPTFLFRQYRPGKCLLRYSKTKKNFFYAIKTRTSKSSKIDIIPKGLTHGFHTKIIIFPNFLVRQYRPGKCLLRYSRTQKRLSKL